MRISLPEVRSTGPLRGGSPIVVLALAFAGLATVFNGAHAVIGFGGAGLADFSNEWVYTSIEFVAVGLCFARALARQEDRRHGC